MSYVYDRIWTDARSVEGQVRQLTKIARKKIFREVASEDKTGRAELQNLLDQLEQSDVLRVK